MTALTWYCFRTAPQHEFKAENALALAGLPCFVPRELEFRQNKRDRRRVTTVKHPLIVGHIFVGFDRMPNWWRMFDQRDGFGGLLTSVIGFGGRPLHVPPEGMARLEREPGAYIPHTYSVQTRRGVQIGSDGQVRFGPLTGLQGKITDIRGQRIKLLTEVFGVEREIDLALADVSAA